MTMRKKDYEAIARAIQDARPLAGRTRFLAAYDAVDNVCREIADYCATQDPTFKRDRFLADCGVQS